MKLKKIFRESVWIYLFIFLSAVAGYLLRVLYARTFTVAEYGLFYAVFGFIFLFRPLREFGLGSSQMFFMNRSLNKTEYAKAKGVFVLSLASQIFLSVIVALLIFSLKPYLVKNFFRSELAGPMIDILLLYFIVHAVFYNIANVFGSFQKHFIFQMRDPLIVIFAFLFSLLFLRMNYSYLSMPLSHLFAGLVSLAIYGVLYLKGLRQLKLKAAYSYETTKEVFFYAFAMSLGSFAWVILSYLHSTILTWMRGVESVGYYNVILPSVQIIFLLTNPIINLLFPIATNFYHSNRNKELSSLISLIYNNFLILTLPIAVIFFIYSQKIIAFIFGQKYLSASTALKVYIVFWIFIFIRQLNLVFISSIGEAKYSSKLLWIEVAFNVIASVILIRSLDYMGAVLAGGIGALIISVLTFDFLKKKVAIRIDYHQQLKTLLCGVIFTLSAIFLEKRVFITIGRWSVVLEGLIVLSASGIVYLLSLILMKVVTKEKVLAAKRMMF